jgi:hypothetical protein
MTLTGEKWTTEKPVPPHYFVHHKPAGTSLGSNQSPCANRPVTAWARALSVSSLCLLHITNCTALPKN